MVRHIDYFLVLLVLISLLNGCSLAPERPFTKQELNKTGIYTYYTINDSPESVLQELNKSGEVVIEGKYRTREVYIKLLGKRTGISVSVIEK